MGDVRDDAQRLYDQLGAVLEAFDRADAAEADHAQAKADYDAALAACRLGAVEDETRRLRARLSVVETICDAANLVVADQPWRVQVDRAMTMSGAGAAPPVPPQAETSEQ